MDENDPRRKTWFKPGNTIGKTGGRPKLPDDLRKIRAMGQRKFMETIAKITSLQVANGEFEDIVANGNLDAFERAVASMWTVIMAKGDAIKFNILMDRYLGKPREHAEMDFTSDELVDGMPYMTSEQEAELRAKNPDYMDQDVVDLARIYGKESIAKVLSDSRSRNKVLGLIERTIETYGRGLAKVDEREQAEAEAMAKAQAEAEAAAAAQEVTPTSELQSEPVPATTEPQGEEPSIK